MDGQVQIKASDLGRMLGMPDLTISPVSLDTVVGVRQDDEKREQQQQAPATPTHAQAGVGLTGTVEHGGHRDHVTAYGDDLALRRCGGDQAEEARADQRPGHRRDVRAASCRASSAVRHVADLEEPAAAVRREASGVQVQSGALVVQGKAENIVLAVMA